MAKPNLKLAVDNPEPIGPSERFLSLTRNPRLPVPKRFEPTVKAVGDIVI